MTLKKIEIQSNDTEKVGTEIHSNEINQIENQIENQINQNEIQPIEMNQTPLFKKRLLDELKTESLNKKLKGNSFHI